MKKSNFRIRAFLSGFIIGAVCAAIFSISTQPRAEICPNKYDLMVEGLSMALVGYEIGYIPPMAKKPQ